MRLKSVTLKGFKSFPDRTRLDFGPGVSVVVGPNGSGKSNVTDAVLWAMGEQSPLAVRGQSMQDVIFGGGHGVQPRAAAEVEIVLDNSDGAVTLPLSEISIVRRLERNGDGGYRLNGARCRLVDVIEILSDTGLGKESHSVISQGRVDAIVMSKPRDRRMLIEEAAGLGKHRKRRRRAQLKLERTQENLDRALDVEREARSRLRPLKRQAEAAELHERLERQILQARLALTREDVRVRRHELTSAEAVAASARAQRAELESALEHTARERGEAERGLSERAERHDRLAARLYETRSVQERLALRGEQAAAAARAIALRRERSRAELERLQEHDRAEPADADIAAPGGRIAELERALASVAAERERELTGQLAGLEAELARERDAAGIAERELDSARQAREQAERDGVAARSSLSALEQAAREARSESERIGAELAGVNQFLRAHARVGGEDVGATPSLLGEELRVREGYELALAAALAGRLDAAVVENVPRAHELLDRSGPDGGVALLAESGEGESRAAGPPPAPGALRLLELVSGSPLALALARRLLVDAWVVDSLDGLPPGFAGIAATRGGRVLFAGAGEVRQLGEGGSERVLARRNERDRLLAASARAATAEQAAIAARARALAVARDAEASSSRSEEALRAAERATVEATERLRRGEWVIEQRRQAPAQGPVAVRIAELEGELAAERRQAERAAHERRERMSRIGALRLQLEADRRAEPLCARLCAAIALAAEAVGERAGLLGGELAEDQRAGETMTARLRECATRESELQGLLRAAGEDVTNAEVAAQRIRDAAAEAEHELHGVCERLGIEDREQAGAEPGDGESAPAAGTEPVALSVEEREALSARVQRLAGRREQLGPVNPLAQEEYAQALAHVQELEDQRVDLETALRELRGVIRETDRHIEQAFEETFAAAAQNFEELVGDVFPGGSGRLRLVQEEQPQRPVLGGQPLEESSEEAAEEEVEGVAQGIDGRELPGVEIEVTPAGKSMKRLSLLSGGEKSMTALAFLFAVFLARPCPFYILDEVEAALDDLNLDRFLVLLRRHSARAQFIVITHQKRTMEAADWLYGVSMGADGVSKVISHRLPPEQESPERVGDGPADLARVA